MFVPQLIDKVKPSVVQHSSLARGLQTERERREERKERKRNDTICKLKLREREKTTEQNELPTLCSGGLRRGGRERMELKLVV